MAKNDDELRGELDDVARERGGRQNHRATAVHPSPTAVTATATMAPVTTVTVLTTATTTRVMILMAGPADDANVTEDANEVDDERGSHGESVVGLT
ncbi:uncharacterized protein IUM83_18732 [Phytophthora cinnamomi]|uniref:uncharacterized protein n=1 Tax=Phytophthora cinnamomi TaxID=4785 RepID=UPI00355A8243|nr:hypothetical protein IUM83_18732 [Phytophthora cinnamomi]